MGKLRSILPLRAGHIVFVSDMLMTFICLGGAIFLRHEFSLNMLDYYFSGPLLFTTTAVSFGLSYWYFGLYRGMWRFASTQDLEQILKATVAGTLGNAFLLILATRMEGIPRSLFILHPALLILGLGGMRFSYRRLRDFFNPKKSTTRSRVLIIGAGQGGTRLARELAQNPELNTQLVGFIDDDPAKQGRTINGVAVLGKTEKLYYVAEKMSIQGIYVAMPSASKADFKRVLATSLRTGAQVKTLPKITEILQGKSKANQLREVSPEDLLGRDCVNLDMASVSQMVADKVVLVTGAGGSIGSELCRQLVHFKPKSLILFELSEYLLHEIEIELKSAHPNLELISIVGDVKDYPQLELSFDRQAPQVVLHAAAYKHVPLMERNPYQAIQTNILGTLNVARICRKKQVERMVMISTDKAVNPTNVMGASKRIAEMVVNAEQQLTDKTVFTMVRFGNVLGSNGSVIPLFKKQIAKGGPVTVTHPKITRYFMSIPEACQLVLQSAAMSLSGQIFVLDMGKPIKIADLARQMILMSGNTPNVDIKIEYTGLREGEKLYEELLADEESTERSSHQSIRIGKRRENPPHFVDNIEKLLDLPLNAAELQIHQLIARLVPEFKSRLIGDKNHRLDLH